MTKLKAQKSISRMQLLFSNRGFISKLTTSPLILTSHVNLEATIWEKRKRNLIPTPLMRCIYNILQVVDIVSPIYNYNNSHIFNEQHIETEWYISFKCRRDLKIIRSFKSMHVVFISILNFETVILKNWFENWVECSFSFGEAGFVIRQFRETLIFEHHKLFFWLLWTLFSFVVVIRSQIIMSHYVFQRFDVWTA